MNRGGHRLQHLRGLGLLHEAVEASAIRVQKEVPKVAADDAPPEVGLEARTGVHDGHILFQHQDDVALGPCHRRQRMGHPSRLLQLCVLLLHAPHCEPLLPHMVFVAPCAMKLHDADEDDYGSDSPRVVHGRADEKRD